LKKNAYFEQMPILRTFRKILLFGRLKKIGETLGKVYKAKRKLCWKIKKNLPKI